ncbi:MAG: IclR family transcriptional regulator [Propionibacteriaceae bacterium]|nr:IclR family transcriptional regulator [Propionibacteriaceae bacterium]
MSAISKAVDAIEVVLQAGGPIRLTELAAELGVAKSSAHRLVTALEEAHLLSRTDLGALTVGPRLLGWAASTDASSRLRVVAEPLMRQLRDETGETINLHVRRGTARICLISMPGRFSLVPFFRIGEPIPLDRGAAGRALLAFAPQDVIDEVSHHFEAHGAAPLPEELRRWREERWVVITDEIEPGLAAAATVILPRTGEMAALALGGSSARLDDARFRELRPLMLRCADEIAHRLAETDKPR